MSTSTAIAKATDIVPTMSTPTIATPTATAKLRHGHGHGHGLIHVHGDGHGCGHARATTRPRFPTGSGRSPPARSSSGVSTLRCRERRGSNAGRRPAPGGETSHAGLCDVLVLSRLLRTYGTRVRLFACVGRHDTKSRAISCVFSVVNEVQKHLLLRAEAVIIGRRGSTFTK